MQTITPQLRELLKSKLQAGPARGHGGRVVIGGRSYIAKSIDIDKSLRMQADQATVELANPNIVLGWGASSIFPTNERIKIFQWYGDRANEVQTFDGIIDNPKDHRDVPATSLVCRDRFGILIDQTFSSSAPQSAGEAGAVRTPANGVYLNAEVSDILNDILDRTGWPSADRDIEISSFVLTEYVISDGSTYADAITGTDHLTGLTGYDAWADELGVFHFAPTPSSDIVEVPVDVAYHFRTGEDIIQLDDSTDQYELVTRVKARGPLTTTTVAAGWHLEWQTYKIPRPVGVMYLPADSTRLRVISASTKKLYNIRLSDRQVMSSVYLGGAIPHPLGLSGDPADATIYWVLNAPWYYGGSGGNSLKKVRLSDNVVLATYALPDGRWSAVKVSSSWIWLTNLDTDRFYRRVKTTGAASADYRHTYASVLQSNPSGLMVDGTTLFLFWANGGTTARFLKCDESDPGTVTAAVATTGSTLHGGEMNTTTHTECFGDNDSLGLTAAFSLVTTSTGTVQTAAEVVDTDLEDELGTLAQLEPRVHDTHPGDAAHPWESRRMSLDLSSISSLVQAADTARFTLDKVGRRKRVLDAGIIGNPALQKNDLVSVTDPVTGIFQNFVLDTYRTTMGPGTYLGTLSLVRGGVANDEITEPNPPPPDSGGDATDPSGSLVELCVTAPVANVGSYFRGPVVYKGTFAPELAPDAADIEINHWQITGALPSGGWAYFALVYSWDGVEQLSFIAADNYGAGGPYTGNLCWNGGGISACQGIEGGTPSVPTPGLQLSRPNPAVTEVLEIYGVFGVNNTAAAPTTFCMTFNTATVKDDQTGLVIPNEA